MTIGIDARMLGKGFGLARYVEQLLQQLDAQQHDHHIVVFLGREAKKYFHPKNTEKFTIIETNISWYSWGEQLLFPYIIKRARVDVMHFPHFTVPLLYRDKFIVTVHDLTMYHYPRPEATTRGAMVYKIKDMVHRIVLNSAVRRAEHIITTSEYTKQDIYKTLGVALQKMTTVYQAPGILSTPTEEKNTNRAPYLLYVGAAYPHKNIEGLLAAWKLYIEEYGAKYQLLLVGKENYFWNQLQSKISESPQVSYLGFQTDEALAALYQQASAFVFPSLSEGFGIPPLEAMQYGLPVLSSNAACLPEVLGDAALYTDPKNNELFAERIHKILSDQILRGELRMKGAKQVQRYTSEKFGKDMIAIYNAL